MVNADPSYWMVDARALSVCDKKGSGVLIGGFLMTVVKAQKEGMLQSDRHRVALSNQEYHSLPNGLTTLMDYQCHL